MLHEFLGKKYVINLVDTPGHVDFSGKVTRAMRSIDGAIVVIDAVEGVMAQTESVLRTAIEERVRPVIFINKIDRLIRELKLPLNQIQERLTEIIDQVNNFIAEVSGSDVSRSWQVNTETDTVAFGSALHKWGFTVRQMKESKLLFQDILEYYQRDQVKALATRLPIVEAVQDMIVKQLPPPHEAQKYRIQKIWKGDLNSPAGLALQECDKEGPLIISIIKLIEDSRYGQIAIGRIFSGTIRRGTMTRVLPREQQHPVQRVSLFMGQRKINVPTITAGNICGLSGLKDIHAGDTIIGIAKLAGMVPFEEIKYVTEPVVTIAIEPMHTKDLPRLLEFLEALTNQDPNLVSHVNEATGEYLLSGLGILHLEIATGEIKKAGIAVMVSDPIVLYRETPKQSATLNTFYQSLNSENGIRLTVNSSVVMNERPSTFTDAIWFQDERGNQLLVAKAEQDIPETAKEALISGFLWACERGPLSGEPLGSVNVRIVDLKLSDYLPNRGKVELMSMIKEAIFKAFEKSGMTLLEPTYEIQLTVPGEFIREITGILVQKRGKVEQIDHKGAFVSITGIIPVSETFDLATVLRSQTSGRATWQTQFNAWLTVPEKHVEPIVSTIRKRKGLSTK